MSHKEDMFNHLVEELAHSPITVDLMRSRPGEEHEVVMEVLDPDTKQWHLFAEGSIEERDNFESAPFVRRLGEDDEYIYYAGLRPACEHCKACQEQADTSSLN